MSAVAEHTKFPARASFNWKDPLLLEEQLDESEFMIQAASRSFADTELRPRVGGDFMGEDSDPALFRLMGKTGLLGITLPEEFGGSDAGYVSYGLATREIERVDSGYRSMMSVQSSLVIYPIYAFGDNAQRAKYLPRLASGGMDRMLWPHRTRCRFRCRQSENAR